MSEFGRFIQTLQDLGVVHRVNHCPQKEPWQQVILDAGHNFTAFACTVVEVQETQFLFLNSGGVFILTRNQDTHHIEVQQRITPNGKITEERRIVYFTDGDQTYEDLCAIDPRAR
jgi:hypothetical protein